MEDANLGMPTRLPQGSSLAALRKPSRLISTLIAFRDSAEERLLRPQFQNHERVWNRLWPRSRIVRSSRRRGFEVRRLREDVMRLWIESHRARAKLRVDVPHDAVFIRRVLMNHGQQSLADRGKHKPSARIVAVAVRIPADGWRRDDLAGVRVEYRDHLVACREQAVVLGIRR